MMDAAIVNKCQKYIRWAASEYVWNISENHTPKIIFEKGEPQELAWVTDDDWDIHVNETLAKKLSNPDDPFWKNMEYQLMHEVGHLKQREIGIKSKTLQVDNAVKRLSDDERSRMIRRFISSTLTEFTNEYSSIRILDKLGKEDIYKFHTNYSVKALVPQWLKGIDTKEGIRTLILCRWPYLVGNKIANRIGKNFYYDIMKQVYEKAKTLGIDTNMLKKHLETAEDYFHDLPLKQEKGAYYVKNPWFGGRADKKAENLVKLAEDLYSVLV